MNNLTLLILYLFSIIEVLCDVEDVEEVMNMDGLSMLSTDSISPRWVTALYVINYKCSRKLLKAVNGDLKVISGFELRSPAIIFFIELSII